MGSTLNRSTNILFYLSILCISFFYDIGYTESKNVAVLEFNNITCPEYIDKSNIFTLKSDQNYNFLGSLISEMLITDLFINNFSILERIDTKNISNEIFLSNTGLINRDKSYSALSIAGADYIVYGYVEMLKNNEIIIKPYIYNSENNISMRTYKSKSDNILNLENIILADIIEKLNTNNKSNSLSFIKNGTLAIFPFLDNSLIRSNQHGELIQQEFTTNIIKYKNVILIERTKINELLKEIKFQLSGLTDIETLLEVGKMYNADYILVGSYFIENNLIRIDFRVININTTKIVYANKVVGKLSLFELIIAENINNILYEN